MRKLEGPERIRQALAHLASRLVYEDRADPYPLVGDHSAAAALQMVPTLTRSVSLLKNLPAFLKNFLIPMTPPYFTIP